MSDFIYSLRLDDILFLLNSGHPPIIVQLACVNFVLAIAFITGRMRKHPKSRHKSTVVVQWLIVISTFTVVSEQIWLPYAQKSQSSVISHVGEVLRSY